MAALVRAASLSNYAEVARQMGLDPHRMLREAALDAAVLTNPDLRVPAATVSALLEASAERSACPTFGLRMAESRRLSDLGAISLLITHQPSLADVLETMDRYRHLMNEALVMHVERAGELVIVREELVTGAEAPGRQARELAIGTLFRLFRALLGPRWRPDSVHFTHAAPADLSVHRRLFGLDVQFESELNGVVCASADLDRPNPAADPAMARYALQYLETLPQARAGSIVLETRQAIQLLMPLGQASIERVAPTLGLNVRTLQRRLAVGGVAFADLLNEVRRELAERHLANPANSLTQVAALLGYAQLSSFTRWFQAEYQTAPSRWRAQGRLTGTTLPGQRASRPQS